MTETRTIELPTVHQRACELPGGPLLAILVGLKNSIAHTLEDLRSPLFSGKKDDPARTIRGAIGMASGMYYTPNMQRRDMEAYAVEMQEVCLAMLLCEERCAEAFATAVELEGGAVRYVVKVLASRYANLSCLSVLRDLPQIHVDIRLLDDEYSWKQEEVCDE